MGLTESSGLWLRQAGMASVLQAASLLEAALGFVPTRLESNSKNVIHTNIYKTSARGGDARRSRRVPIVRTDRAERLAVHGPRRALGNGLAEVVREVGHEGHELERLDDVEGAVAVVA